MNKFEAILQADDLFVAMRWLNNRVPNRYSAVLSFDGDMLRNICLIDKENSSISHCADQPIAESYCMYIRRSAVEDLFRNPRGFVASAANSEISVNPRRAVEHE